MNGGLTVNEGVQELISEYHGVLPPQLTMNETDMLLAALLMELKAQRLSGGSTESAEFIIEQQRADYADGSDSTRGTYYSNEITVETGEWTEIELDFTASEFDLRKISDPIKIAFTKPSVDDAVIQYDSSDSPIAGIGVMTSKVWIKAASTSTTFRMEAWL